MMMEEKCPFCGRKAQIESKRSWNGRKILYSIRCTTSNCMGHPTEPTVFFEKEQAIKAWNRRADNATKS